MNNGNADGEVEACTVTHEINNRGQIIESNLSNLNGQVRNNYDNNDDQENI